MRKEDWIIHIYTDLISTRSEQPIVRDESYEGDGKREGVGGRGQEKCLTGVDKVLKGDVIDIAAPAAGLRVGIVGSAEDLDPRPVLGVVHRDVPDEDVCDDIGCDERKDKGEKER